MGGLTAWRIGVLAATMIGLMTIFTVIGRTRADEEAGRTELLMAGVVGRSAQLVAAVITAAGAALMIGVVVAAAGIAQGAPVPGSMALGAAFTGCGWVFAGVAAVTAQLAENARTATAMAGAVLGVGYAIRAVGDTVERVGLAAVAQPAGLGDPGQRLRHRSGGGARPVPGSRPWCCWRSRCCCCTAVMSGWRCSRRGSARPGTRGWTPQRRWRPGCTADL